MQEQAKDDEVPGAHAKASACPFTAHPAKDPNGCPVSSRAAAFDPFEEEYQLDPAECLRWARESEPVFYSPKLGYYVATRYEDVQHIFRDNVTFSPSVALEKITPFSNEAQEVLKTYDYGMNRTLVNEDEPAHMERRRALMHSFNPDQLAEHEPMIQQLACEFVDRFVDRGEADLVEDMLWEVPLSVALHFLGVPEEDMSKLREYSIAHTVNTWGRPTPDQQVEIAHKVGHFWQLAGRVLGKMRATPDEHGWMRYAIRRQKDVPDVVTDSYLHSMMMAIIVAAHETTAHASANALLALLQNRALWKQLCEDPDLIPNAVEECLRFTGSVAAWRRITTQDTMVGGVSIPAGSRLLMISASANHDPRHFENPDTIDLYRANTTDHLTFGYGSHQCMGKNIARMEMRIFIEELTRRLPHMELVPGQRFTYVANTSFRGPEHLRVRWDPARNPERLSGTKSTPKRNFPIGAPSNKDVARSVTASAIEPEAERIVRVTLTARPGESLPGWTPGSHIELVLGDIVRRYSLCGRPGEPAWDISVLRENESRGGSAYVHEQLRQGAEVKVRGPKNHFQLDDSHIGGFVLVAGGIGVTPIAAMADRLKKLGRYYTIHYCGRARRSMALLDRLVDDHGGRLMIYPAEEGLRLDVAALTAAADDGTQIYACGPERLLDALAGGMAERPGQLHVEHFTATETRLDPNNEIVFDAELRDSGLTVRVAADQTLLEAVRAIGIDVQSDCEEGLCGTCQVDVLQGDIDHRDRVLTGEERGAGDRMMACCSRGRGKLVLSL
ncbi:cytochrome P450/oxidoreductase [Mesorhizobium sp. YR577]|uniref:cytochrome P450/oxidoreductase n=1 Tax=Mesorhizobium sp. YR577 TaxID=1884373 RepID=UPI0008E892B4|nr:cytochrome P450/oxidoreductase [Mesorhizobium sp. YR577]SFU21803.1 Cytochrome P450 [Mesorhizobium sp. YR577]